MRVWRKKAVGCGAALALLASTAAAIAAERQAPDVLRPTESAVAAIRLRMPALVYSKDGEFIMLLAKGGGKDAAYEWTKPDKVKLDERHELALQVAPVRAAEVVAAFPLGAQIEEFRDKLHLKDGAAVLAEKSSEKAEKAPLPAFRFLGVRIERRIVDVRGEAVTHWDEVDLQSGYAPLIVLAGGPSRLPAESPRLRRVCVPGLTLPKLPTLGYALAPPEDEYPPLEEELKGLKASLGAAPAAGYDRPGDAPAPDVCLLRVFDVNIEEGKTYEYRLQVRMANPNYGRPDAAAGVDTKCKELAGGDWYVVPRRLTVPTDLHFYAVDQAKLDGAPSEGETAPPSVQPMRADQTALQIHRWVDFVTLKERFDYRIGDWVIAERVVATRGQPIGVQRIELAYWRRHSNRFVLANDQPGDQGPATAQVAFAPHDLEPILVDFTGDAAPPAEVLLCTADGKLVARNSAVDAADPDRIRRLHAVRAAIRAAKASGDGKADNPGK